ncbi:RNA polymerase Rpb5, C-terminal domain [Giardia duodenalis]|uniref:RNA polymerase Rpb5, C-terminal domain n=1 Tax=Giardia intestinalis TaxID=5741 RepID=V6TLW4_GIAIN|nr:RNA polymerase Rpb5, C-terminal domain [Giardia intestinalis]
MDSLALDHIARVHTVVLEMYRDRGYEMGPLEKQMGLSAEEVGRLIDDNVTNLRPLWFIVTKGPVATAVVYSILPWVDASAAIGQYVDQEAVQKCLFVYFGGPAASCRSEHRVINDVEVDIHDFSQFLINPTKHRLVPKHTILSNTEKARVLAELRVTEAQIPLIQTSDPIMRWYDAKPGDLIRITRTSGSAGKHLYYRLCY